MFRRNTEHVAKEEKEEEEEIKIRMKQIFPVALFLQRDDEAAK